MCPIKLLLTLALRLGNVAETCIEDLVHNTAQRKNRTVLWTFPERPVLCAFSSNGSTISLDKPAGNHQLGQTMAQASLAAGLFGRLHSHDLRRGAARDSANLKGKSKGIANKVATTVLGHNSSSINRPLTSHYVGAHDDDIWTKRIDENYADSIYKMPEAQSSYQGKFQKFKERDITDACIFEGLDAKADKDRKKASKLLEKRRQAEWVDQDNRKRQMLDAHSQDASLSVELPTAKLDGRGDDVMME
jgi:hypothetical protein